MFCNDGKLRPMDIAKSKFVLPATKLLIVVIRTASLAETLRVKLLSIAQQRHAPMTNKDPGVKAKFPSGDQDKMIPPTTIATMPTTMRRS
ncbi:hypothetical protein D3C72_2137400 [compost metagenome]